MARTRIRHLVHARTAKLNLYFFHHCAEVIQKFWRGWWSRKYLHDFYARQAYLQKVVAQGERTNTYLRRMHEVKLAEAKAQDEVATRKAFAELSGELHHLLGTHTSPGVFNPPYSDTLPMVFNTPVEQHLRENLRVRLPRAIKRPAQWPEGPKSARADLQHASWTRRPDELNSTTPLAPSKPPPNRRSPLATRTANIGRLRPIQGPFKSKEEIEAAHYNAHTTHGGVSDGSPFEAQEESRRLEQRLDKYTRISASEFTIPKVQLPKFPSSVIAEGPYSDRPFSFRGSYGDGTPSPVQSKSPKKLISLSGSPVQVAEAWQAKGAESLPIEVS